jgi:D-ribose pyranase
VPTVPQVLTAVRPNFVIGQAWMAEEFCRENTAATQARFAEGLAGVHVAYEPHAAFKQRVPRAIGLIRTGDSVQYANVILESG